MSDQKGAAPQMKRAKLIGFPGEAQVIVAVPHYVGDKAHLNAHGPNGAPGLYTVAFVLAKPTAWNLAENEIKLTCPPSLVQG